ncbi:hypothetical protein KSF_105850 [Reticulibacter mediterranei]|uniref:Uncharacterized protein n=1 Tax=Reticulibacter mediterranei TaxID=2778369 RepID=A0A8J3N6N4_9CHLR|nr:hypothetical protein KSF_105850 [Reticulibacter mediterranei]
MEEAGEEAEGEAIETEQIAAEAEAGATATKEEESTQGDSVEEVPGNTAVVEEGHSTVEEETPHDES